MASHGRCRIDDSFIAAKEVPNVHNLQDPEHDPVGADKDVAQREGIDVAARLAVDEGVVHVADSGDELQDERQQGQDLVGGNVTPSTFDIARKRIR